MTLWRIYQTIFLIFLPKTRFCSVTKHHGGHCMTYKVEKWVSTFSGVAFELLCTTTNSHGIQFQFDFQAGSQDSTEIHFFNFFSGWFITAILVNPPERKRQSAPLQSVISNQIISFFRKGARSSWERFHVSITKPDYTSCNAHFNASLNFKFGWETIHTFAKIDF